MSTLAYKGNPLIFGAGTSRDFTLDQAMEYAKCEKDPIYFIEKYVKIITIDHGLQPMKLYDFQKEIIHSITVGNRLISACARQMGKCHSKDTKYTIRNKKTGEISTIAAEDFHEKHMHQTPKLSILSEAIRGSF